MTAPVAATESDATSRTIETLKFDNTYGRLPEAFYTRLAPTPLPNIRLANFNADAASLIELDPREAGRPEFAEYFGGARPLPGGDPLAMLYAGHQFGSYVPQLGDGRAILLGEVRTSRGDKWDLHLKGAGRTPYSRMGDGRAVLRSTVREYLCSEAMHGLGIPTTRALCILVGDEPVYRETVERGAMLIRMSPSHVRFGSFEIFAHRRQNDRLKELADYVIEQFFPHLVEVAEEQRYADLLGQTVARTARLMARWQAVGFAHGVMNTDNMSILGVTLDYGPYGFLDDYDPGFICNHSDYTGRYAFDQQPAVGFWNLTRLAQALLPLMTQETALAALNTFRDICFKHYEELMFAKLGFIEANQDNRFLLTSLLMLMERDRADYTTVWRRLGSISTSDEAAPANRRVLDAFTDRDAAAAWLRDYAARLNAEGRPDPDRKHAMDAANPKYILRNYLAQTAIERAEQEDFTEVDRLLDLLRRPFDDQPENERYAEPPPEWGKRLEISCSS